MPATVRLLLRLRRHVAVHVRDTELLVANGVEVYGDQLTHAKVVFADSRHGAVFSAKLDARRGSPPASRSTASQPSRRPADTSG